MLGPSRVFIMGPTEHLQPHYLKHQKSKSLTRYNVPSCKVRRLRRDELAPNCFEVRHAAELVPHLATDTLGYVALKQAVL